MNITFDELRRIKDNLPAGSIKVIAQRLNISEDTVRNYFGGGHYKTGDCVGFHLEQGTGGGIVALDDTTIYDMAITILEEQKEYS